MTSAGAGHGGGKVSEEIGRVEAELASLWATPDEKTGQAKVRASMLNLAVVCAAQGLDALRESSDDLTQTHPGRVFLLTLDARLEPWELKTEISAVCRADAGALLCSDRVEIGFGSMVASRASSVVGSLALAEVPMIVESAFAAPPALVDALAARSDRLVVDSAHTAWSRLAELVKIQPAIGDRNFVRAYSWRELTARFFDEVPDAARSIREIEIGRTGGGRAEHRRAKRGEAEPGAGDVGGRSPPTVSEPAALLLGWIGGRLGWRFQSAERALDAAGREVRIGRKDDPRSDVGPGEVTSVRIVTEWGGARLELCCARTEAPRMVRWTMQGARTTSHEHPLGFRDETWVLVKAIDAVDGDRVYRETVQAAAEYSALLG